MHRAGDLMRFGRPGRLTHAVPDAGEGTPGSSLWPPRAQPGETDNLRGILQAACRSRGGPGRQWWPPRVQPWVAAGAPAAAPEPPTRELGTFPVTANICEPGNQLRSSEQTHTATHSCGYLTRHGSSRLPQSRNFPCWYLHQCQAELASPGPCGLGLGSHGWLTAAGRTV